MQSCQHHWLAAPLCVSLLTQAARSAHTHCTWGISAYLACPASQPYPWLWGSLDLTSIRGGRAHLPPEQVKMSDALRSCAQCQYMWLRLSLRGVEFGRGASESEKGAAEKPVWWWLVKAAVATTCRLRGRIGVGSSGGVQSPGPAATVEGTVEGALKHGVPWPSQTSCVGRFGWDCNTCPAVATPFLSFLLLAALWFCDQPNT